MGSPQKPALVLLHGMTSSGRAWEELVPSLSQHYAVHTPTALGHHGGVPVLRSTTLTDVVDAAERQLDEAGLDRPHVVGHSLGGYMALAHAATRPGATTGIVVLNTGSGLKDVAGVMKGVELVKTQPYRVDPDMEDLRRVMAAL